jgi:type II secretory pathway component PulJ
MKTPVQRRGGTTLIEMVAVISITSTLLSLCGVAIARMMRAHAVSTEVHAAERAAWRLSHDLRADAAVATSATVDVEGDALTMSLTTDRGVVRYRFAGPRVTRTSSEDNGREDYRVQGAGDWGGEVNAARGLVAVRSSAPSPAPLAPPAPVVRLHARLGLAGEAGGTP